MIGNPPYVNVKRGIDENEKEYFKSSYKTAQGQFDLFCLFIEIGSRFGRILSMIVPKPVINNENYISTREIILMNGLCCVVTGSEIFESAGVESCIFLTNNRNGNTKVLEYKNRAFHYKCETDTAVFLALPFKMINTELNESDFKLISKIKEDSIQFSKILETTRGIEGGKSDDSITTTKTKYKLLRGEDLLQYSTVHQGYYAKMDFVNVSKFKTEDLYSGEKILIRRVGNQLISSFDSENYVTLNTIYICKPLTEDFDLMYLVGLLNSSTLKFWFKKVFVLTDKLFPYVRISQLEYLPIKETINQGLIAEIVNKILLCKKSDPNFNTLFLEREINIRVYHLYNLTFKEAKTIDETLTEEEFIRLK